MFEAPSQRSRGPCLNMRQRTPLRAKINQNTIIAHGRSPAHGTRMAGPRAAVNSAGRTGRVVVQPERERPEVTVPRAVSTFDGRARPSAPPEVGAESEGTLCRDRDHPIPRPWLPSLVRTALAHSKCPGAPRKAAPVSEAARSVGHSGRTLSRATRGGRRRARLRPIM